jgi:hypothetical protein
LCGELSIVVSFEVQRFKPTAFYDSRLAEKSIIAHQIKVFFVSQYHRQLWAGGRLKNWVNSAQSGDLLENVSQ